MNRKHLKYSPDWVKEIPNLVPKTEKVKEASGKEVDKILVERLLTERGILETEIKKLKADIDKAGSNYSTIAYLKKQINRLENNRGLTTETYQGLSKAFHNLWDQKIKNWYQTADRQWKNNLYKLNLNGTNYEITEEEVLNLMARVVKALENVEATDFTTKYTAEGGTNTGLAGWLTDIKAEAPLIKIGSSKVSRKSYHFPETYPQKPDNHTKYSGTRVYQQFFNLVKEVKSQGAFLSKLDADLQKDVPQTEKYQIFLKGDKYGDSELKDYGIEIANNQSLYKTGKVTVEFEVKGGIKGWIDLANSIMVNDNETKLLSSLTRTNNPNWNLFNDLLDSVNAATADFEEGTKLDWTNTFQKGGRTYSLDTMPKSLDEYQKQLSIFKAKTGADNVRVAKWLDELDKKSAEKAQKEKEIDKMITERLVELRTQLTQFKIKEGFELTKKADGTVDKDNRRTAADISQIKQLLVDIRYLENADDTLLSSVADENTAYDKVIKIEKEAKSHLLYYLMVEGGTNKEKIDQIKKNPLQGISYLQRCLDEFNRIEKYVKLTDTEKQLKKDIETVMGKKDDTETLKTYTEVLKIFDVSLETSFTESLKTKWQGDEAKNFQNTTVLKSLLESVKKDDKYDDFFNYIKGGTNGYEEVKSIDTWGKLLVKDPKVVITTIKRYEYDHLDDLGEDKDKKKTQMERKIKKVLSKKGTDSLTDKEINDTLYEVAIGNKTLNAKSLKADLSEYEENQNGTPPKGHFEKYWGWYVGIVGGLSVLGGVTFYFWDKIKNWWEPKKEEGEYESDE